MAAMSRWIVIADSPFLPARNGGQRENLGFVEAMVEAGWLAGLVLPTDRRPEALGRDDDLAAIEELIAPAPLLLTPRRRFLTAIPRLPLHPYIVASRPAPRGFGAVVRERVPDADGIVVFSLKSIDIGHALAKQLQLPLVLRQHNLEGPYHHALAGSRRPPASWLIHVEGVRIHRLDLRLERAPWITGIADISMTDARIRAGRSRVPVAHVPPFALGPAAAKEGPSWAPTAPVVVFVGALDVGTNHDAIEWFAREVWPLVHGAHPQARWQVVGRAPTAGVRDLIGRTPGAELHADVPDPRTFLREAAVAVNPTVSGSGINIKLVEYLSVGVPIVSTTKGQAGLGLEEGKDLEVADGPAAFADAVGRLLTQPEVAQAMGDAGAASARRLLDVRLSLRTMAELMSGRGATPA